MAGSGGIGGGSFWCNLEPKGTKKRKFKDTSAKKRVVVRVKGRKKPYVFAIQPGRKQVFVRFSWS